MTIVYIALAVLMFGVMITVHEAGHFFAARIVRIPVREFAIGFGPSLFSWNSKKHETKFHLRLIPVGGYCAFSLGKFRQLGVDLCARSPGGNHITFRREQFITSNNGST